MDRRFRLAAVLRARQAQEDSARAEVIRARAASNAALQALRQSEAALHATAPPTGSNGRAVVAALVARQALAAGVAEARTGAWLADEQTAAQVTDLAAASRRRRAVEKLSERHAAARRAAEQAAAQRELDDLAGAAVLRQVTPR